MTPSGTTHYVYDLQGHLLPEASGTGTTLREYVWLDDMPLAVVVDVDTTSPNLYFVHADHLERPIKMTEGSKTTVWDAVYRPFGEVHAITGSASNNLRFPGQYFLIEAGLHYNWHRHYHATIGRYRQPDPPEFVDGASVYAYAKSTRVMKVDPNGGQIVIPRPGPGFTPVPPRHSKNGRSMPNAEQRDFGSFYRDYVGIPNSRMTPEGIAKKFQKNFGRCTDIYVEDPNSLPGTGRDYAGRLRRCIRECMEANGCHGF
jgi:RHS repeat-associated protein